MVIYRHVKSQKHTIHVLIVLMGVSAAYVTGINLPEKRPVIQETKAVT